MHLNATIVLETKVLRNLGLKKIHLSWLITVLKKLRLAYNLLQIMLQPKSKATCMWKKSQILFIFH